VGAALGTEVGSGVGLVRIYVGTRVGLMVGHSLGTDVGEGDPPFPYL